MASSNHGPHGKSAKAISDNITKIVQQGTKDPTTQAPGIVVQVVDANGNTITQTASGVRSLNTKEPVTTDSVFWIASCTKNITGIALMQLWESGKANLDSADQLEEVCPELKDVKILGEDGKLRDKTERITLRMCMTHTAGMSYSFFHDGIWKDHLKGQVEKDEFNGSFDAFQQPLICEPGSYRHYAIGIDWVGFFIERVSGKSLQDYFHEFIFKPLEMTSTSFTLTEDMAKRMVSMHQRSPDMKSVSENKEHVFLPARGVLPEDVTQPVYSGGGGLISTADDYCKVIAMMLNDGLSPHTGAKILESTTLEEMFTNQLLEWDSKYKHDGFPIARDTLAQPYLKDGIPSAGPEGWGLNFQLYGDERFADKVDKKGVIFPRGSAPGICNVFWALDRELGIGGILMSQILPFGDPSVFGTWVEVQGAMFDGAKKLGSLGVQDGEDDI